MAGLASRAAAIPLESFTVVFKETDYSEAASASASARRFGMKHHEVMLSGRDLLNALPDVFAAMDQPSLDGLNTFVVSRAVRAYGLKAVMSDLEEMSCLAATHLFFARRESLRCGDCRV